MAKFIYLFIVFIFTCQISVSQSILFDYDAAGNRILRKESVPLPVTLISFTAEKSQESSEAPYALLNWQTTSETNSDRFDIERSQDGKKWLTVGAVQANGDKISNSDYSFPDKYPADGENLYRLKMIDRDGTFAFSRIQRVYFENIISFYPNPVKDLLKVTGINSGTVQVLNTSGKTVLNLNHIPANGIDMSAMPAGIYIVTISGKDGISTAKKIVKH